MEQYEIVGLKASDNGRSCERHHVCGDSVQEGDILRMKECVVNYNDKLKESIKFVTVVNGRECCTVGFLPQYLVVRAVREGCKDRFVEVLKLYSHSPNIIERRKDHVNKGMALCMLIDNVEGVQALE
jgi:hypothetical protein